MNYEDYLIRNTNENKAVYFKIKDKFFLYSMKAGVFVEVKEPLYKALKDWDGKSHETLESVLSAEGIHINSKKLLENLFFSPLSDLGNKSAFNIEKNRPSNFWILVTDACNLKCTYCYHNEEGKKKWNTNMSKETAEKAVDLFFSKYAADYVVVNFFGGEPLLNFSLIEEIVPYIIEKSKQFNKEIQFTISTNGVFVTHEIAKFFKRYNFFVTVSIDGGEEQHNKTRKLLNGEGSFRKVREGVNILGQHMEYLGARMTVTKENVGYLNESFEQLFSMGFDSVAYKLAGACDDSFVISMADVEIFEREIKKIAATFKRRLMRGDIKVADRILQWIKKINKRPLKSECPFATNGKIVVDPLGHFYGCQEAVGNFSFIVGDIYNGIDNDKIRSLAPPLIHNRKGCKNCWMNELCDGMCYYAGYVKYGHFNTHVEESCIEIQKSFLESLFLYGELYIENKEYLNQIIKCQYTDVDKLREYVLANPSFFKLQENSAFTGGVL
ncbi:ParLac system radical SAM/SPASM peptide maturase [Paramaledivibacter caminithermalis]|uniref:Radical SAM additional 4Fe4S-binding SPASM domain-containing protein n=1 Tax=Paramaledivibacter caminithermalis (strain DSM 15212 / CIP 107654 / DViRD3) TaxID=1121301 RepID=A0A1M6SBV9_PARC5|nr:ParLac system radical SAM/SPASM peptide maturase [Paramaledivibacter caminithermalis]SHK41988.1 radical SAM additional 4Fe4S-binding SPASM domain-containing protein [Paramaledivibacter caminithermalis DSM 15212]